MMTQQKANEIITVNDEQFQEFYDWNKRVVNGVLAKGELKGFAPMLTILAAGIDKREVLVFALDVNFNEYEEKVSAEVVLEKELVPCAAALATECWIAGYDPKKEEYVQPRHNPNRKEGINLAVVSMLPRRTMVQHILITRATDNTILPGDWSDLQQDGVNGVKLQANILNRLWYGFGQAGLKKFKGKVTFPLN
jgi:hypothetical protein